MSESEVRKQQENILTFLEEKRNYRKESCRKVGVQYVPSNIRGSVHSWIENSKQFRERVGTSA